MPENYDALLQAAYFPFAGTLLLLERLHALQPRYAQITTRWNSNIALFLISGLLTKLLLPVGLVAFALGQPAGPMQSWGLPLTLQLILAVLMLDLAHYGTHRLYHCVPLLWRVHLVHHSDPQLDVTTAERHHPLEALIGLSVMLATIAAFGLPAEGVGLYLLIVVAVQLPAHANLRFPATLDRVLNWLLVTPPMHRLHHSDQQPLTDSNYGSVFSLWDRLFGSFSDPRDAHPARFGLGYFREQAGGDLVRVLQQPFLYHAGMGVMPARDLAHMTEEASQAPVDAAAVPAIGISAAWKLALQGIAAGCLLVLLALWPTASGLATTWSNNESYLYGWLVAPTLIYLLGWHYRSQTLALTPRPGWAGVAGALSAAAGWAAAELVNIEVGRQFALVLALQAVLLCALGWPVYRRLFPALALLFLMVPCGDVLLPLLRRLTLESVVLFATLADLPYRVDGFVIHVVRNGYIIIDDCAGMTYVALGMFLGYCFGLMLYRSGLKAAALSLAGASLAFLSNVVRINAIVATDLLQGVQMPLTEHAGFQSFGLLLTFALLLVVLHRLAGDAATPDAKVAPWPTTTPASRGYAPAVAGLTVMAVVAAVWQLTPDQPADTRHASPLAAPATLAGWERVAPSAPWLHDALTRTASASLSYGRGSRAMHVVETQTLAPSAKLPRFAPDGIEQGQWREKNVQQQRACDASGCVALRHTTWSRLQSPSVRHSYTLYLVDGWSTTSELALRAAHGWSRLTGHQHPPRAISVLYDGTPAPGDELAQIFRTLRATRSAASR